MSADAAPVTWPELRGFCEERQGHCHALMQQQQQTHALQVEHERRKGYTELQASVDLLRAEVQTLKEMLSSRSVWVLPRPILYLLCAGMAGIGAAGKELGSLILGWFGVKVGG